MRFLNLVLVGGLALSGVGVVVAQDAPVSEVDKLIGDLGADDFKKRDEAQRKLEALGPRALPALEKAEKEAKDAEVRARAHEAITSIKKGGPGPAAPKDQERNGDAKPFVPAPLPRGGPRILPAPQDESELEDFFKMFERGNSLPKIFERLQKQLEELDGEVEKELGGQKGRGNVRVFQFGNKARSIAERKLGLGLGAPPPAVRAQLDLPGTDSGLMIEELAPGGPAWKAGLKQYDIVTAIDGRAVRTPADLIGLGEKAGKLEIIRKAKKETLVVHAPGGEAEKPAEPKKAEPKKEELRKF